MSRKVINVVPEGKKPNYSNFNLTQAEMGTIETPTLNLYISETDIDSFLNKEYVSFYEENLSITLLLQKKGQLDNNTIAYNINNEEVLGFAILSISDRKIQLIIAA